MIRRSLLEFRAEDVVGQVEEAESEGLAPPRLLRLPRLHAHDLLELYILGLTSHSNLFCFLYEIFEFFYKVSSIVQRFFWHLGIAKTVILTKMYQ